MSEEVAGGRGLPNLGLTAFFLLGEHLWNDEMSDNMLWLSALCQGVCIDKVDSLPSVSPEGQVYILDETALSNANKVAISDWGGVGGLERVWKYRIPEEGWLIYNQTQGYFERFTGTVWTRFDPNAHFKGPFDASTQPEYPAAEEGDTYVITVGGKIGGANGKEVREGDFVVAIQDNIGGIEEDVGAVWIAPSRWLKGAIDLTSNPDYPAGLLGEAWFTENAGKIGGADGINAQGHALLICLEDNAGGDHETVGFNWLYIPRSSFKRAGLIDASGNPNYPRAMGGDWYEIIADGKVGGAAGKAVVDGDWVFATAENDGGSEAAVGGSWRVAPFGASGARFYSELEDVLLTDLADGDIPVYDEYAEKWTNVPLAAAVSGAIFDALLEILIAGDGIVLTPDLEYELLTISINKASATDIIEATSDDLVVTPAELENAETAVPIAYAANIELDFSNARNFTIGTLTGNLVLDNPLSANAGHRGNIFFTQDGTGGRTVSFDTNWTLVSGTVNLEADSESVLTYLVRGLEVLAWFGGGGATFADVTETSAGTEAAKAVTPDGLAGSRFGMAVVTIAVTDPNGDALETGGDPAIYPIPAALNGMNLIAAEGFLTTTSSSGSVTVQVDNGGDMLSSAITIAASSTFDAGVVDAANDDVSTGDILEIIITGAGTDAKGLVVQLTFQLP